MKTFLAVYIGHDQSPNHEAWTKLDEPTRQKRVDAGLKAWYAWGDQHKDAIVENGAPLGKTKRVSQSGLSDIKTNMTGYTVVRADSHEAAARMFENHPHFTIFPGDSVEIMECLPIPGQA
jgi:hypothetical protein